MFAVMVRRALTRRRGGRALLALTTGIGAIIATALLSVMFDVADNVQEELQSYGANIVVQPRRAALVSDIYDTSDLPTESASFLNESDIVNIKTIFWAFNITGLAPSLNTEVTVGGSTAPVVGTWFSRMLHLPTEEHTTVGLIDLKPWWTFDGGWIADEDTDMAIVGRQLAAANGWVVGDSIRLEGEASTTTVRIAGIITSGDDAEHQIILPLAVAQELAGREGQVDRVDVRALTTPENDLARRAARDPRSLTVTEWETWYCTAYASAIAYQIEEVIPDASAKAVRQVTETQGVILVKTQAIMLLVCLLSLVAAALAIANLVTASVMERSAEIGLLKAVGATDGAVVRLIMSELVLVGLGGGVLGYGLGLAAAQAVGWAVFSTWITPRIAVAALVAVGVPAVVLGGSLPAIRMLLRLKPAEVLHGR